MFQSFAAMPEDERMHRILVLDLFTRHPMNEALEQRRQEAHQQLVEVPSDEFLSTPEATLVEMLLTSASFEVPTLHREEAELLEPAEGPIVFYLPGNKVVRHFSGCFTLAVPMAGDVDVFSLRPSTYPNDPPLANFTDATRTQKEMRLYCEGGRRADGVRREFDRQLSQIEQCLDWSRKDINFYRRAVEIEIVNAISERRARLHADRRTQVNIGFSIRPRPDANTYAVPVRRRKVETPKRAPARRFTPEPTLPTSQYEAALAVLCNMRNALERNPSTTRHLGEDQIRDLLLVSLNAQFEGNAAGEVFNGAGKTDILIRVDDRNVFIGECKIWDGRKTGPKIVTDALNQLFGYLVWRDTKAALLLFIRDADATTVTAKAVAKIQDHPNYKRRGKTSTEERYDFVLHTPDDPAREIHLALLPFVIAGKD